MKNFSKTFTQNTEAILTYIYLLWPNLFPQEEPLGFSLFGEANYLITQHVYIVPYLVIMLPRIFRNGINGKEVAYIQKV